MFLQGAAYDAIRSDSRLDFGFVFADCIRLLAPDCLVDPQIQEGCPADKAPASRAVHMKCYRNIWKQHIIAWWYLAKVKQYRHISLSLSLCLAVPPYITGEVKYRAARWKHIADCLAVCISSNTPLDMDGLTFRISTLLCSFSQSLLSFNV